MLDDKDAVLLAALRLDGRTSYVKLGESVGLSADAVRVRVERLIANGTVRLATLIDPNIFGLSTRVTVGVTVLGDSAEFVQWAREQGELIHLVRVMGRFSFLAEVLSTSLAAAHEIVFERIGSAPGVIGVDAWPVIEILRWREDTRQAPTTKNDFVIEDEDIDLMRALVDEPRIRLVELATRLDRPYATLRRRSQALYRAGIMRTTAIIDDAKLSNAVSALFLVSIKGERDAVRDAMLSCDLITILTATAGRYAFVGEIVAGSLAEISSTVSRLSTNTYADFQVLPYARVDKLPASLSFRHLDKAKNVDQRAEFAG